MPGAETQACETPAITVSIVFVTHTLSVTDAAAWSWTACRARTHPSFTSRPAAAGGSAHLPASSYSTTAPEWPARTPQRWQAARCVSPTLFMSSLGSFSLTVCTKTPILCCQGPPEPQFPAPWAALPTAQPGVPASPLASLGCWPTALGRALRAPSTAPCLATAHQLGRLLTAALASTLLWLEVQLSIYRRSCTGFLCIPENQPGNAV